MPHLSKREAIDLARGRLGLKPGIRASAFTVLRIDPAADGVYYLLVFGEPEAAVAVAAVDVATRNVTTWATLPGTAPHTLIDGETASRHAGLPGKSRAQLVWKSSPGSRSPLYPLWQISTEEETVYVDQQGRVWQSLESPTRGG
jgi:hypothetical protein